MYYKAKKLILSIIMLNILTSGNYVLAKAIPYTLEDRDRLIRIETTLKEFKDSVDRRFESVDRRFESIDKRFESIDKRFESVDKRFDELINIFIGIVASFAGIVAVTIGFAIWDRKTALSPVIKVTSKVEEREERIERVLKEYANKEPALKEILQRVGIL